MRISLPEFLEMEARTKRNSGPRRAPATATASIEVPAGPSGGKTPAALKNDYGKFKGGEKELQRQLGQLLRLRGIWFAWNRMDKATSGVLGTPDFLFSIRGQACAWEVKVGGSQLSDEQEKTRGAMDSQGWSYAVIRSTESAFEFLKVFGSGLL